MLVLVILHQTGSLHDSGILTCPFFFLWRRKFKSFNERSIEDLHSSWCQCLTLRPLDCSLPGSSVHGIFQVRILEWVGIPFSRGSSQPRNWTQISCNVGRFFTIWATREAHKTHIVLQNSGVKVILFSMSNGYSTDYLLFITVTTFALITEVGNHDFQFMVMNP